MANTHKDIIITPNRGSSTDDPKIDLKGGNTSQNTVITLRVYPGANGTISIEGPSGQLFSITNDMGNTIYSVNDISGIPSIEVYANGDMSLAPFGGNVRVGGNNITQLAFSNVNANGTFLVADSNNDLLELVASANVDIQGNASGDNAKFDLVATGVVAGVYGGDRANDVTITVDTMGRIKTIANVASLIYRQHLVDTTIANVTTAQPWFPVFGNVTVAAATTYYVEGFFHLIDTTKTHTVSIAIHGTAGIEQYNLELWGSAKANNSGANTATNAEKSFRAVWHGPTRALSTDIATNITNTIGSNYIKIQGTIRISTAGTINPRLTMSDIGAPQAGYTLPTMKAGSYFLMYPTAANTVNAIGTWT